MQRRSRRRDRLFAHIPRTRWLPSARLTAILSAMLFIGSLAGTSVAHADPSAPAQSAADPGAGVGIAPKANVCEPDYGNCSGPPGGGLNPPPPPPPKYCTPEITRSAIRVNGGGQVGFGARLDCYNFAPDIDAITYLVDRTQGHDGQPLSPEIHAHGTGSVTMPQYAAFLSDNNFPAGSQVEVVFELVATGDSTWVCNALPPGLRYVNPCQTSGTTVHAWIGTGNITTNVQAPAEECRDDNTPAGDPLLIQVIPHIRYCGYFNWVGNSHVTRVEKLQTTEIRPASGKVCDANFFPNPPAADGVPVADGVTGRFQVQVRFTLGPCSGVAQPPGYIVIDRVYQTNGQIQFNDHVQ